MLTRRSLILGGLGVTALIPTLPVLRAFPGNRNSNDDNVLVVLQLSGGNDGLNTVIPWSQDEYWRLRPNLAQAKARMLRLNDDLALHPSLRGLADLYHDGQVAIYQGIGLPKANRSHFRSMDIWHAASLDQPLPSTGWLGRLADQIGTNTPGGLPALAIGGGELPGSLRADRVQPSAVRNLASLKFDPRTKSIANKRNALLDQPRTGDLAFLAETARASYATAARLESLKSLQTTANYPNTTLAQSFALVAQLLGANLGTRIFHLELTGFDTHSRQAPIHAARLNQLSSALAAFQKDLQARNLSKKVRTLVFSEFGRRAKENGSKGTDHGHAAPAFLVGQNLTPGLQGQTPNLTKLSNGDIPATQDFRSLLAALETDWMGQPTLWKGERARI